MFEEQETYRGWLLSQPPEEILNHTYEYTVREDILMALENNDISDEQAAALLKSSAPLGDVFKDFENRETGYMDIVLDCISARAEDVLRDEREQREAMRNTPVYKYPASYARENNELEIYRASNKANIACKEAIQAAISGHYSDNSLHPGGVKEVVEQFGFDRFTFSPTPSNSRIGTGAIPTTIKHGPKQYPSLRTRTHGATTATVILL